VASGVTVPVKFVHFTFVDRGKFLAAFVAAEFSVDRLETNDVPHASQANC
jgi:hypothetical protein